MIIKRIVAAFFLVFIIFPAWRQNIDSMNTLIEEKNGPERVSLHFDISDDLIANDDDAALKYAYRGYRLSGKFKKKNMARFRIH